MELTPTLVSLAAAAIDFELARRVALRLKELRDPIECDQMPTGADGNTEFVACWKRWKVDRTGEGFDRDEIPTWCASCQRRQALTDALRKANRSRGARMRTFRRHAFRGIGINDIEKEVRQHMGDEDETREVNPAAEKVSDQADGAGDEPKADDAEKDPAHEG